MHIENVPEVNPEGVHGFSEYLAAVIQKKGRTGKELRVSYREIAFKNFAVKQA